MAEFKKNLPWAERLDLTNQPAADVTAKIEGRLPEKQSSGEIDAEDDFQREMHL